MFVLDRKIDAFVTYDHEANWFTCRTRAGRRKSSSHNRHDLQDVEVHIRAESEGVSYITLKSGDRDLVLSNKRCLQSKRFGSFTFIWNEQHMSWTWRRTTWHNSKSLRSLRVRKRVQSQRVQSVWGLGWPGADDDPRDQIHEHKGNFNSVGFRHFHLPLLYFRSTLSTASCSNPRKVAVTWASGSIPVPAPWSRCSTPSLCWSQEDSSHALPSMFAAWTIQDFELALKNKIFINKSDRIQ